MARPQPSAKRILQVTNEKGKKPRASPGVGAEADVNIDTGRGAAWRFFLAARAGQYARVCISYRQRDKSGLIDGRFLFSSFYAPTIPPAAL